MALTENDKLRKKLLTACGKLSSQAEWVLRLLSVVYVPLKRDDIARCMGRCGRSAVELDKILARLNKAKLLEISENEIMCHHLLREPLTRLSTKDGGFHAMAGAIREVVWRGINWNDKEIDTYDKAIARIRTAMYLGNQQDCLACINNCSRLFPDEYENQHPYVVICNDPFDGKWLQSLPPRIMLEALICILNHSLKHLIPAKECFDIFKSYCEKNKESSIAIYLIPHWIYRGKIARAKKTVKPITASNTDSFQAWLELLQGNYDQALKQFTKIEEQEDIINQPSIINIFYALLLLQNGREEDVAYITLQESKKSKNPYAIAFRIIDWLRRRRDNFFTSPVPQIDDEELAISKLVYFLALYWEENAMLASELDKLVEFYEDAAAAGYDWFAAEAAEILARCEGVDESLWAGHLVRLRKSCRSTPLIELFKTQNGWERKLLALSQIPQSIESENDITYDTRLAWLLSFNDNIDIYELQPVEQRLNSNNQWGKGRKVSLQRLFEEKTNLPFLDEHDKSICNAIVISYTGTGRASQIHYDFDYDKALLALVNHPRVYRADAPAVRIEINSGEPELIARKTDNRLHIFLDPVLDEQTNVSLKREGPNRIKVIKSAPAHRRISSIIGAQGIYVPNDAFEQTKPVIEQLSQYLTVQSDIGITDLIAEDLQADERPRVQLMPSGHGLKMEILIRPFTDLGGYYHPGTGAKTIITEHQGKKLRVTRNLMHELDNADMIIQSCPSLKNCREKDGIWEINDIIDCLEFLLELDKLEDKIVIEWPQGGRMNVRGQASLSSLGLRVKHSQDWFTLEGQLKVDEDLVIDMHRLLEMSKNSQGRFIQLGKDRYLALTDSFRQRLDEIRDFSEASGKETRLHPLASLALEDLASQVGEFEADLEWKKMLGRLQKIDDFAVPSTLQAELRDYQNDGFTWLSRMAKWGIGACLADDMGLGKTVQSLALLLSRAAHGPALVIAPTSVCFNWQSEIVKFAPSLTSEIFGTTDREQTINNAGKFSVVICSYAMLQKEADLITDKKWNTVILDEAQAIKNASTQRSKAAMKLQSDFRMVTTGTPLENHLGELWNIFNFLNPGLLGSLRRFNHRFAQPIEKDKDDETRKRLKKLISPFILRRVKSEVLTELPPRTEIVKHVEMSAKELAYYEALRREAISGLEEEKGVPHNQKRMQILAQIMRLRRACCHPKLIENGVDIESSKLAEFTEIISELLDNNHKTLVFSQFVDHLHIIRDELDKQGISYQYLDGSTPAAKRRKLVEDFQAGQGDLFLISLKAGGQGLNLTAADYVIHMDPWWNPAVEDQASDRAHRIGQTRPVTIYRLITRGTIEEKILALHEHKRNLAEGLLEGNDLGGKISAEDLLKLIKEN